VQAPRRFPIHLPTRVLWRARPGAVRSAALALLALSLALSIWPASLLARPSNILRCTLPPDFAIPGGWFFQEQKRPQNQEFCLGYSVVDDDQAAMWSEFYRLGGVKVLGYPVSQRYTGPGGYIQQGFEFAVLQWRPEENRALPALVFEQFHDAGLDPQLRFFSIPEPVAPPPGGYADEVAIRQSWLTDPEIMARYLTDPRDGQPWPLQEMAWDFYGLPQGPPERVTYGPTSSYPLLAPFVTQRFQRFSLRLLLADDPTQPVNRKGCVATVRSGALARLLHLIPPGAAQEEPAQEGPVLVSEVQPEQFVPATSDTPSLVTVTISLLNFQPNEIVDFTATPLSQPTNATPKPWEQTIGPIPIQVDARGQATRDVQLWTVSYTLQAIGRNSGANLAVVKNISALALDQFPVALCQALSSAPNVLIAPTPFVTPAVTPTTPATPLPGQTPTGR